MTKKIPDIEQDRFIESAALRFQLDEIDKKILDLRFKYPSLVSKDIADVLNVAESYVSNKLLKPAMQRAMQEHSKTFFDNLSDLQMLAVKRLKQLVNDQDKNIALSAIKIAMAPMINQHTVNVNNQGDKALYEVKLGENGQIIRGFKSTKDLLESETEKIIDVTPDKK